MSSITNLVFVMIMSTALSYTQDVCQDTFFKDRSYCMNNGKYIRDETGAMSTTASGFYSYYKGKWKQNLEWSDEIDRGHGWYWDLPSPCQLKQMDDKLFCDIMHQIHNSHRVGKKYNSTLLSASTAVAPRLAFVGDSITLLQNNLLSRQLKNMSHVHVPEAGVQHICGVQIKFTRADHLELEENIEETKWIKNVCEADVAVINYGAHAPNIEEYTRRLKAAKEALLAVCGEKIDSRSNRISVYFRTTSEGNPLCYTSKKQYFVNNSMHNWNQIVWPVISGSMSQEYKKQLEIDINEKTLLIKNKLTFYEHRWHWEYFQQYNRIAAREFASHRIHMMDVVALSRLRPTSDWDSWHIAKNRDCLHTNRGATEWNTMLMNVLATELCAA